MQVCLASLFMALLALGVVWLRAAPEGATPSPEAKEPPPAALASVPLRLSSGLSPSRAVMPHEAPSAPLSTYALIIQSQADRNPVVRAQARGLVRACRGAVVALFDAHRKHQSEIDLRTALDSRTALPRLPGEAGVQHEQRQRARELILAHCSSVANDEQALNHPSVSELDAAWHLEFKEALRIQLQAQDFHGAVFQVLMGRKSAVAYFEGLPWGGASPEGYARALYYAMALDPRPSTQTSIQLSMAGNCLESGMCDLDLEAMPLFREPNTPAIRAQAHALAPRIYAAMKEGRVEAFLPPAAPAP